MGHQFCPTQRWKLARKTVCIKIILLQSYPLCLVSGASSDLSGEVLVSAWNLLPYLLSLLGGCCLFHSHVDRLSTETGKVLQVTGHIPLFQKGECSTQKL